jgi:hypothetical protein
VIAVVFDTGVIISAVGWRGPAHRSLALEKPFGIPIMRPAAFLLWMDQRH